MNTKFLAGMILLAALPLAARAESEAPSGGVSSTVAPSAAPAATADSESYNGGLFGGGLFGGGLFSGGGEGGDCHLWLTTEYLRWKIKDAPVPFPLLTSGTTGVLGAPGTTVL